MSPSTLLKRPSAFLPVLQLAAAVAAPTPVFLLRW
jgi:hypothetical protein